MPGPMQSPFAPLGPGGPGGSPGGRAGSFGQPAMGGGPAGPMGMGGLMGGGAAVSPHMNWQGAGVHDPSKIGHMPGFTVDSLLPPTLRPNFQAPLPQQQAPMPGGPGNPALTDSGGSGNRTDVAGQIGKNMNQALSPFISEGR